MRIILNCFLIIFIMSSISCGFIPPDLLGTWTLIDSSRHDDASGTLKIENESYDTDFEFDDSPYSANGTGAAAVNAREKKIMLENFLQNNTTATFEYTTTINSLVLDGKDASGRNWKLKFTK